jgi:signal transduction histidine kinase
VRSRDVQALLPLPPQDLPDEVRPLVEALNALLQRLADAFDGQRAFVADAAHELRSPLTALKLQAQVLRRADDEATRDAALTALQAGVERAIRLVEQLLALARAEPGARAPALVPLAPAVIAREVLADAAMMASQRGSTLSLDADDSVQVIGDAAGLGTLLRNLVDNALRYTPAGGQVRVGVAREGDQARLRVDDSGPGIPPEQHERVFERFVRGDAAAGQTGSGLGLAIVRGIALRHGATLRLDRSPLGGLRVDLGFPARPAGAGAPRPG